MKLMFINVLMSEKKLMIKLKFNEKLKLIKISFLINLIKIWFINFIKEKCKLTLTGKKTPRILLK